MVGLATRESEKCTNLLTTSEFEDFQELILKQKQKNGWFTEESVRQAMLSLGNQLSTEQLNTWQLPYSFTDKPKKVAIIMAGNIPLVGFHDFLCVLLSGNSAVCKLSSDDQSLLPALAEILMKIAPAFGDRIVFTQGRLGEIEAVIATGSDNSKLYFEQYFGKYPHIFRSNRTSLAVLSGNETDDDLQQLGFDIFNYFGLGCRNVSHLLLPRGFSLNRIFENITSFSEAINHHKYANNYDYNRAIFLMNSVPFLDNNIILLRENTELVSPLAVVHYQFYDDVKEVENFIEQQGEKIQAIVGQKYIPFGKAQSPALSDYADNVDTMQFLNSL